MPTEIYLLKVGMTMTEGVVDEWYAADGAEVKTGDPPLSVSRPKR